jgi:hypothetical protein
MAKVKLPLVANLHINAFAGGSISSMSSFMKNTILKKDGSGNVYITQRPGLSLIFDASDTVSDAKGRAVYYWPTTSDVYFVNDDTIYKTNYTNSIGTITSGIEKCKFIELGDYLVLIDSQNNEIWAIESDDTVTEITDVDLPSTIVGGGAQLNQRLYIMDNVGTIYHSDLNDPTLWTSTNIITAERENDSGVYLAKQHDHIVAMGARTLEFFYDAGNPTGSVLSRRQDIAFNIGCADKESVWQEGDRLFFLGITLRGTVSAYVLEGFTPKQVSLPELDSYFTTTLVGDGLACAGSGFSAAGHTFYLLTFYYTSGGVAVPQESIVYDATADMWMKWDTHMTELTGLKFPLVDWSIRGGTSLRYGEGIMINGDVVSINDNLTSSDSTQVLTYVNTDYVDSGYITDTPSEGTNIHIQIRISHWDAGTAEYKYINRAQFLGDKTSSSQTLNISWSDSDDHTSLTTARSFDLSRNDILTRLGRTVRRTWEVEYEGSEALIMNAIELDVDMGDVQ